MRLSKFQSILPVAILAVASFVVTLLAPGIQAEGNAPQATAYQITIDENGSWTVGFEGTDITFSQSLVNSMSAPFGFTAPAVDPTLVNFLTSHGVTDITVAKRAGWVLISVNGKELPQLQLSSEAEELAEALYPGTGELVKLAMLLNGVVEIRLPGTTTGVWVPEPLSPPEVLGERNIATFVQATLLPGGKVSLAGLPTDALGVPIGVDPQVANALRSTDVRRVDLTAYEGQVTVDINMKLVTRILWNTESRRNALELAQRLLGVSLNPQVVALTEATLEDTQITATLFVADTPQDGPPAVHISQPLVVPAVDGRLMYRGVDLGISVDQNLLQKIGNVHLCAARGEIRTAVRGKTMPVVLPTPGFVAEAAKLAGAPLDPSFASWVEEVLGQSTMQMVLATGDVQKIPDLCTYEVAEPPPALFTLKADVGVGREGNFDLALGDLAFGFKGMGRQVIPATVKSAGIRATPGRLNLAVNGNGLATVAYDEETLVHALGSLKEVLPGVGVAVGQASPLLRMVDLDIQATVR